MGLADEADDVVHDVLVTVMSLPRLYREGFDGLLDTVLWRRCTALLHRRHAHARACRNATLLPAPQPDHAQDVVDRLHAAWALADAAGLEVGHLRVLALLAHGTTRTSIARLTGSTVPDVDRALRVARNHARRHLRRRGTTP